MLDIKLIRENPDKVKAAMKTRNKDMDAVVDEILAIDKQVRELTQKADALKAEQNAASKQIPQIKKEGGDISEIMARMNAIKEEVKVLDAEKAELAAKQKTMMYEFPNVPSDTTPVGKDDSENVEIRRWGEPRSFDFEAKAHWDIGADLGILDPETAAKVTGARFHFYRGLGARLERAIINFFLNTHTEHGYTEVFPPFMVNRASMTGTGQLPKFEEDAFKLTNDYFLIPTAEVPVTNMFRDDILDGSQLPMSFCAYSACFRAEAGSAGRDTRGLIRQHQFNKVELVKFTKPEESYAELESLQTTQKECFSFSVFPTELLLFQAVTSASHQQRHTISKYGCPLTADMLKSAPAQTLRTSRQDVLQSAIRTAPRIRHSLYTPLTVQVLQ